MKVDIDLTHKEMEVMSTFFFSQFEAKMEEILSKRTVMSSDVSYTPEDLEELLRKDKRTIVRYLKQGVIPNGYRCGNEWRLTRENYLKYTKSNGTK